MKKIVKPLDRFISNHNKFLTPLEVITCLFIIAGVIRHW